MPDPNDVSQMARDLAMSEPLMVLGKLAAEGGQHVQDAYDTIKQHLSDLGTKAEKAVESGATTVTNAAKSAGSAVSSAAGKVADAIVPKLKAEEANPQQALSDDQLLSVFKDPKADLEMLTPEEQQRLVKLTETATAKPAPFNAPRLVDQPQAAFLGATPAQVGGLARKAVNALPAVGGALGGIVGGIGGTVGGVGVGGVPGAIGGAALGGAAGEAAQQLLNRARGNPAPATAGQAASDIAQQGAIQGGAEAVGAGIGAGAKVAAPWLMQKALKPGVALLDEYRTSAPKLVKTLLDEGINVTQAGVDKLQKLLTATNQEIKAAVANATGSVDKNSVAARALTTANKMAQQVNPTKDLQAVGDTVHEFLDHPVYTGQKLTIPEAQAMKQGTYQQIGKKYGEVSSASIETQKALARGLKEDIAAEVPGIAGLNTRDSELMAALDATGRRVALSGNRDPVGFAWVAQHPVSFLAALFDRSPAVKSLVARGLYNSAATAARVSPQLLRAAIVTLASHESAPAEPSTDSSGNPGSQ